jgi:hypothetical protein
MIEPSANTGGISSDGSQRLRRACLVGLSGCVLGAAMALSPVAVIGVLALAAIVVAAARGLTGLERRVVVLVLLVAIGVRLAAAATLFIVSEPHHLVSFPFDGDGWFLKQRSLWIRNVWLGVPIAPGDFQFAYGSYGWTSYIYLLAYLQYLLSPAPYAVHLVSVCCFVAMAVMLHRMVRHSYGPVTAVVALSVMLFLPTLFMWSVSALKESLYLLLLTAVLFGVLNMVRGRSGAARAMGLVVFVMAATALHTIRVGALLIVATALMIAFVGTFMTRRPYVIALALILVLPVGTRLMDSPAFRSQAMSWLRLSAILHAGHVRTEGYGYKLLDQRLYSTPGALSLAYSPESMTWPEAQRFVLRGLYSIVALPYPWQLRSPVQVSFLPQQLAWYVLVLFAIVGAIQGFRGDVFMTWLLIGMSGAGLAVMALNEGNIGTMVRHRDTVVPFVTCLGAWGMVSVFSLGGLFTSTTGRQPASGTGWPEPAPRCGGGLIAAFLRPRVGYRKDIRMDLESRTDEVLTRIAESSVLISALRRGFAPLVRGWRHATTVSAARRVLMLEIPQRLQLIGRTLIVALCVSALLAPFGDFAWPATFAWMAAAVCAVGLIIGASPLAAAWRGYYRFGSSSPSSVEADIARRWSLTT